MPLATRGSITSATSSIASTLFYADRRPPPDLGKWANFKRFLWNKEKRTFCSRTILAWCKIIAFYLLFVCLIMSLFFVMLITSTNFIREGKGLPWISKEDVQRYPGAGFMPNIAELNSPLIWYTMKGDQAHDNMKAEAYIDSINRFFAPYDEAEENLDLYANCTEKADPNKPCLFLKHDLGPCGTGDFGYKSNQPCFYIKLNKALGWKPEYYTDDKFPETMPPELKQVIHQSQMQDVVWLHCEGNFPFDKDHTGTLTYYPYQGFKGYYFPFKTGVPYLSPLVAVKLDNVKTGFVINIACTVWAVNIDTSMRKAHAAYLQIYLSRD